MSNKRDNWNGFINVIRLEPMHQSRYELLKNFGEGTIENLRTGGIITQTGIGRQLKPFVADIYNQITSRVYTTVLRDLTI